MPEARLERRTGNDPGPPRLGENRGNERNAIRTSSAGFRLTSSMDDASSPGWTALIRRLHLVLMFAGQRAPDERPQRSLVYRSHPTYRRSTTRGCVGSSSPASTRRLHHGCGGVARPHARSASVGGWTFLAGLAPRHRFRMIGPAGFATQARRFGRTWSPDRCCSPDADQRLAAVCLLRG